MGNQALVLHSSTDYSHWSREELRPCSAQSCKSVVEHCPVPYIHGSIHSPNVVRHWPSIGNEHLHILDSELGVADELACACSIDSGRQTLGNIPYIGKLVRLELSRHIQYDRLEHSRME